MTLDLRDCTLAGPALTEAFLRDGLTLSTDADAGWAALRSALTLASSGAVHGHRTLLRALASALGYGRPIRQTPVATRKSDEDGGWIVRSGTASLRVWSAPHSPDPHPRNPCHQDAAPGQRQRLRADASPRHRDSPTRAAQRVLFAARETAGLLTDGATLQVLLCDASRADTCLTIDLAGWVSHETAPASWRILAKLLAAPNLPVLPEILDRARLHQAKVTTALRVQARDAITGFINALPDRGGLAATALWHDALILIYRLLFMLKLESAAGFSFATSTLWRGGFSPNQALGPLVRRHLDHGHETGRMLQDGLRRLFVLFRDGVRASALSVTALGGGLFGASTMPHLDRLDWGEQAAAILLDRLIWLPGKRGMPRARVHYGSLGVEDLGSIYEALLEQEPTFDAEGRFVLRPGPGRKASGAYYTPRDFVRFLVRETLDPLIAAQSPPHDPNPAALLRLKLVDPATGSGHFLVEACRHLSEALLTAARQADALGLTERLAAIPDPDATLLPYLPSRGDNETIARAICRRLVAVHCLYGCDRNKLAVELAKLSLWLESWAEGLPLTFLDHRIVHGDALTGPFFAHLTTLPVTGGPLDPLLAQDVTDCLRQRMDAARVLVSELDASIGRDLADLAEKGAAKQKLDALLEPLRRLARAWTEAAMTGARDGDDRWIAVAREVLAGDGAARGVPGQGASAQGGLTQGILDQCGARLDGPARAGAYASTSASWPGLTGPARRTGTSIGTAVRPPNPGDGPVEPHRHQDNDRWENGLASGRPLSRHGRPCAGHPRTTVEARLAGTRPAMTKKNLPHPRYPDAYAVEPGHDGNAIARDTALDRRTTSDAHPIPWDLTFPDVFPTGFAAVLGNPPWDVVLPNSVDFLTDIEPSIRQAPNRQARAAIQRQALADPAVAARFDAYRASFERLKRITPRLYPLQRAASGSLDLYRLFAERALSLAASDGAIGLVLPSAFHANAGAAGLRRHYLDATHIDWCLSFENRRRWFDIDSRFKFDLIVARRPGPTRTLRCGFYLEHLGDADTPGRIMRYDRRFLDAVGGAHLTPPELRGEADLRIARHLYANPTRLAAWCAERRIRFGCDLHMTADAALFRPAGEGDLALHEGKTFHQFTPAWDTAPRYSVDAAALRPALAEAARHTRLVFRDIARSNDERTMIACLAPPGSVFGHTATVEQAPWARNPRDAGLLCAVFNSFPFDWLIRQKAATHLSLYLLNDLPMPRFTPADEALLARNALRLPHPATRARMDAVVARAYGLDRELYMRVLAGFSHRSWPEAPSACLAAFDAMEAVSCPAA